MIFKNIDEIKRHLKTGIPLPCYFVAGSDDHRRRGVVNKLAEISSGKNSFDIHRFSGNISADALADAVFEVTFGGGRRCILAEDIPFNALGDREYKKFEELVEQVCAENDATLIFTFAAVDSAPKKDAKSDSKTDKKKRDRFTPLKKLIDKCGGGVMQCDSPTKVELCGMMEAAARKYHCTLERSLSYYLIERCGSDSANLLNEVRKTSEYRGSGEITKADIDLMTSPTPDAKIYDLATKISAGDRSSAFVVLDELRSLGQNPNSVLAALSGAFVDMYRAKAARSCGKIKSDMMRDWSRSYARRDFVIDKAMSAQQKYSAALLRECLDILLSAEQMMKGSGGDDDIILDEAVAKIFYINRKSE